MNATVIPDAEAVLASVHVDPRSAAIAAEAVIAHTTDDVERVKARWALGFAHREMANLAQADVSLRRAIADAHELGATVLAARISTTLALVVMNLDTPAAALDIIEQSIAVLDGADRARAVMQRGLVHYRMANFDDALTDHVAAIDDLRAAGDWVALARLQVNVGSIQTFRRDFDAAEHALADAIDLSELNGQALLSGYAHHNLGHLRALRGDVPGALREFDTAKQRYDELAAPPDRVASLMADRARSLADAGLRIEAVEAVDVAYELVRRETHDAEAADIGLLTATIRLEGGEASRAVEPAAWARTIYSMHGRKGWVPLADLVLLRARIHEPDHVRAEQGVRLAGQLEALGWVEEAQTALIFAAELFTRVDDRAAASDALRAAVRLDAVTLRSRSARWLALARGHALAGDLAAARTAVDAGLELLVSNRASVGAVELRSRSIESGADLADLGVELEIERDDPAAIIEVLRTARGAERGVGPSPAHDDVLAGLLVELRQTMNDVRTVDQASSDRVKLRRRQAELERRVRDRARIAPLHSVRPRGGGDQGDHVAVADEVDRLVVVSVDDDRLVEVTTTSSSGARIRKVPLDEPIGRLLESVEFALHRLNREGISSASRAVASSMLDQAGAALDAVLVPEEVRRSNRPVVVTPIDVLHGFAWRVLPSMRTRSITVSSSVGAAAVAQPTATSLLIAGPDLEHSECEIDRIAEVIGDAVVLDARSASVAQVIAAMCEADIVHFACHGTFRSDNPLFSSLHLADGDLTIFELEQCTSLPHTMVLSACNAGQSAVLRGGALLGFASALMQLGLANVVAPLTAVNDEHSVDVMVEFHRRLRQGDDAAGALAAVSANADGLLDPTAAAFSCFGV